MFKQYFKFYLKVITDKQIKTDFRKKNCLILILIPLKYLFQFYNPENVLSLNYLSICLIIMFPISEIINGVIKRTRTDMKKSPDHISEVILWIAITFSVTFAVIFRNTVPFAYALSENTRDILVTLLMGFGMTVRWLAITTLGKYFTFNIIIQPDHHLIRTGIYKYIRHPSYAGLLLVFCGMGLYFLNWLSLVILVVPITAVLLYRIYIEEQLMRKAFGKFYIDYCAKTKRLIPGLI